MAHIALDGDSPGIIGLLKAYPDTARPLSDMAEQLLHAPTPGLSAADREMIGAYVSRLNQCEFCELSHGG
ncbi:MAG: carboxymuconolactone decarboxylase family protein, partial [Longimicrobiales bacterium]